MNVPSAIGTTVKRYARLLLTYVLIAFAVVLLYAPWGLALRPWDYSILRAGMSIICGVALAGIFGASTYLTLKDPDEKLLEPGAVLRDEEVVPVLREYVETPYVGGIASDALEQVQSASRKRKRLHKAIAAQFSEGSITWERFAGLVDQAQRTVLRNAALVANGVQAFDREGYAKDLADLRRKGKQAAGANSIQLQQVGLYEQALAHMQEVVEANERMLLELGKLELELSKLEAGDTLGAGDTTAEELAALIDETKYYA